MTAVNLKTTRAVSLKLLGRMLLKDANKNKYAVAGLDHGFRLG